MGLKAFRKRVLSKTYATALLLGLITAVEMNTQLLSQFIPETYRPWLLMIWPVTMMTLREMTNSALSEDKEEDADKPNS